MSSLLTAYYLNVLLPESYFGKINGHDFNACNNVRYILCNIDVLISLVKLIVHSTDDKLM